MHLLDIPCFSGGLTWSISSFFFLGCGECDIHGKFRDFLVFRIVLHVYSIRYFLSHKMPSFYEGRCGEYQMITLRNQAMAWASPGYNFFFEFLKIKKERDEWDLWRRS